MPGYHKQEQELVRRMVQLCAAINEFPYIRFDGNNQVGMQFAAKFQYQMQARGARPRPTPSRTHPRSCRE